MAPALDGSAEKEVCPACGSDDWDLDGPIIVFGIETYTKRCYECGDTWDAE